MIRAGNQYIRSGYNTDIARLAPRRSGVEKILQTQSSLIEMRIGDARYNSTQGHEGIYLNVFLSSYAWC